jgi:hypothetical protein
LIQHENQRNKWFLIVIGLIVCIFLIVWANSASHGSSGNGATALCNDGTYSFAAHHQGHARATEASTCSISRTGKLSRQSLGSDRHACRQSPSSHNRGAHEEIGSATGGRFYYVTTELRCYFK